MARPPKFLLWLGSGALLLMAIMMLHGSMLTDNIFTVFRQSSMRNVTVPQRPRTPAPMVNPIPSDQRLDQMSHREIQDLYHSYINSPQVPCGRVVRMGKVTDGGWELCDDPLYRPDPHNCLVYSYGINHDFSYDDDIAKYGCQVHAFDPSMNQGPHLRGQRIFFHPTGVADSNSTLDAGVKQGGVWYLYTIASHRRMLGHSPGQRQVDVVKMDVEGHELKSLMAALDDGSLSDVRQLSFETHVSWSKNLDPTKDDYKKFLGLLRKVWDRGFRIYLTHRNYVWSAFISQLDRGRQLVKCHEIHTVNINLARNLSQPTTPSDIPQDFVIRDLQYQNDLLTKEKDWYNKVRQSRTF